MIGFYDSGLGGLTILKQVHAHFPGMATMYYGDTLHCPLGDKTNQEIVHYTKIGVSFLFENGCDLVILACNTATALAICELQNNWLSTAYPSKKILGIIRPVSERMLQIHTNKSINIGILATSATIRSHFYDDEMRKAGYTNIFSISCVGLADSIEKQNNKEVKGILDDIFTANLENIRKLDVVILACTHYPIAREIIAQKLQQYGAKREIRLLSQGIMVAERLSDYLINHDEISKEKGTPRYFVTSEPVDFQNKMQQIFGIDGQALLI
jgi:glutamate racemase